MATQMTSARRGIATDEMKQVAKDEDVSLDWLIPKIARGSIIIPSNNVRPQKIHNVGIGKGLKTKVNVNIGTSTLNVNLNEEIEKAESEIQELRDKAPEKINKIAVETSADLLHRLIGAEVNNSSISAIVDDLSRKKMDKYYGN